MLKWCEQDADHTVFFISVPFCFASLCSSPMAFIDLDVMPCNTHNMAQPMLSVCFEQKCISKEYGCASGKKRLKQSIFYFSISIDLPRSNLYHDAIHISFRKIWLQLRLISINQSRNWILFWLIKERYSESGIFSAALFLICAVRGAKTTKEIIQRRMQWVGRRYTQLIWLYHRTFSSQPRSETICTD